MLEENGLFNKDSLDADFFLYAKNFIRGKQQENVDTTHYETAVKYLHKWMGGGDIMSVKELADFLRLDANTIYSKCAKGEMPHFKMGKLLKFKKSEILDWVKGLENGSDCSVDEYVNRYMQQKIFKS